MCLTQSPAVCTINNRIQRNITSHKGGNISPHAELEDFFVGVILELSDARKPLTNPEYLGFINSDKIQPAGVVCGVACGKACLTVN